MRHPHRELKDGVTVEALLKRSLVGRLATVNRDGFPVIKPVNFLFWDGKIYLHSSQKGEKVADIRRGSRVCFEVDEPVAYAVAAGKACSASYYYRSIVIKGRAGLVRHQCKKRGLLERMMEKYQPEGGYGALSERVLRKTAVIEISVHRMTAKENLG